MAPVHHHAPISYDPQKAVSSQAERKTLELEEVMPQRSADQIRSVFGKDPCGRFFTGKQGATHYTLESPTETSAATPRELVVRHGSGVGAPARCHGGVRPGMPHRYASTGWAQTSVSMTI
jgi:hypothetical protein